MILLLVTAVAACGGGSGVCDLKSPPQAAACPAGVVEDSNANRCTDSMGLPYICRNGLGYCLICSGVSFSDGCTISGASGNNSYCVHHCSGC
jgi:hypothetical protein